MRDRIPYQIFGYFVHKMFDVVTLLYTTIWNIYPYVKHVLTPLVSNGVS